MPHRLLALGSAVLAVLLALALTSAGAAGSGSAGRRTAGENWPHSTIATAANPELLNYLAEPDPAARTALARIALTPRVRWFANCRSCNVDRVRETVAAYVADARRDDPDALVQLAVFGLWPDGEVVDGVRPPMSWSMERYQAWIAGIAAGIGDARVALVLEPDLAISANHRGGSTDPSAATRMQMTAWAAQYLSQTLTRESIYIDAGSADWLTVKEAARLLRRSGIQHVRGFALGATHYDSVPDNVAFAARLSAALARKGITGKRAVIDTADNGTPFTWLEWKARWGRKFQRTGDLAYQFDNTPTCGSRKERVCQTLGHRPTADPVDDEAEKLGLRTRKQRRLATRYVDAYLWFGRGWRWMQQGGNNPETRERSIRMATWTRFAQVQ